MSAPPTPDADWVAGLRHRLLDFFARSARPMPWRETRDPYAIWVSEIMLQQTRVETVIPYFRSWMDRFPTVEALSEAPEAEVLKEWEGLGYYSRARNLHRAASVVRERHGGRLPADLGQLRSLPGVGDYTAGAVGSIAFGLRAPAVDGNVRRVVARLMDWPDPRGKRLRETVAAWVPEHAPGDFNQALMELVATVCTPRSPRCEVCPLAELCAARGAGTVRARPVARKRAPVRREERVVAVLAVRRDGPPRFALQRRPDTGLLAGMWEFPSAALEAETEPETAVLALAGDTRHPGAAPRPLSPVPHAFTHLQVTYRPYLLSAGPESAPPPGAEWFTPDQIGALPLPVAQQSIVETALAALESEPPLD